MSEIFLDVNPPEGFNSYVRRLERAVNMHARVAGERTAGASATPERIDGQPPAGLGNNTKSWAAFREETDQETFEIQGFRLHPVRREYVAEVGAQIAARTARTARFLSQGSATKLLFNHLTPRGTQWRVTGCARRKISQNVTVMHSASIDKAHFGGLMICGSVWTCPPCAAKVSERRKLEIQGATDTHRAAGGALYMITHTFSHQRSDKLALTLKGFSKARAHMRAQRAYKALKKEMGYVGDMRALEVTWGEANGFHPHEHDLWLVEKSLTRDQLRKLQAVLFTIWEKSCLVAKLAAPNRKRGVNIKAMDSAAEYLAKFGRESTWGTASELTKQHSKKGKEGRYSSFDLLRLYEAGQKRMGALFLEFAECFFGKRQVIWSPGLKAAFGVREVSDEVLAVEQEEDSVMVTEISAEEWSAVIRHPYDVRAQILDLAESGGVDAVRLFLDLVVRREVDRLRIVANEQPKKRLLPRSMPGDAWSRKLFPSD